LAKISIFGENFDFWRKFRFLAKISIFGENFDFCSKFQFFDRNVFTFEKMVKFEPIFGKKLFSFEATIDEKLKYYQI